MTAALLHAVSQCDQCGQWDDHPKIHVGVPVAGPVPAALLPLLTSSRHHDCVPNKDKLDILAGTHSQHALITAKIFDAAANGTHGHELREFIAGLEMPDHGDAQMATTGMDQAMANAIVTALLPTTGTATVGTVTVTAPIKCRFDTTMTTSGASASTEWSTSGGYTAGGVSVGSNWAAASAGARATNAAVTVTNAPAGTWAGCELWDSSGTPLRSWYGALAGGNKTVNSGDTCTILSGSLSGAISI